MPIKLHMYMYIIYNQSRYSWYYKRERERITFKTSIKGKKFPLCNPFLYKSVSKRIIKAHYYLFLLSSFSNYMYYNTQQVSYLQVICWRWLPQWHHCQIMKWIIPWGSLHQLYQWPYIREGGREGREGREGGREKGGRKGGREWRREGEWTLRHILLSTNLKLIKTQEVNIASNITRNVSYWIIEFHWMTRRPWQPLLESMDPFKRIETNYNVHVSFFYFILNF